MPLLDQCGSRQCNGCDLLRKTPAMSQAASQTAVPPNTSPLIGMALIVAGFVVIPVMDGLAKMMTQSYPVLQVVWARYFFHVLIFLPIVYWRFGRRMFRLERPGMQLYRSVALLASTICFFTAVKVVPLADAVAVVFVYPFVITALSPWLLGEHVGVWRWSAVSVGFVGVLIALSPNLGASGQAFEPAIFYAVAAGLLFATYALATRKMAGSDPALITLFWTGMVGTLVMTAIVPAVWVTPTWPDFAVMVSLGLLAAIGHYLIILAHEYASAPQLAPFGYIELVAAAVVGYMLFGDVPAFITWIGMTIVVASGLVIAWREARLHRIKRSP